MLLLAGRVSQHLSLSDIVRFTGLRYRVVTVSDDIVDSGIETVKLANNEQKAWTSATQHIAGGGTVTLVYNRYDSAYVFQKLCFPDHQMTSDGGPQ